MRGSVYPAKAPALPLCCPMGLGGHGQRALERTEPFSRPSLVSRVDLLVPECAGGSMHSPGGQLCSRIWKRELFCFHGECRAEGPAVALATGPGAVCRLLAVSPARKAALGVQPRDFWGGRYQGWCDSTGRQRREQVEQGVLLYREPRSLGGSVRPSCSPAGGTAVW